jgi:hypothetical protein
LPSPDVSAKMCGMREIGVQLACPIALLVYIQELPLIAGHGTCVDLAITLIAVAFDLLFSMVLHPGAATKRVV